MAINKRLIIKYVPVSLVGAFVLTVAFFGNAFAVLSYDDDAYRFLFERGFVQYLSVFLFSFGLMKLINRFIEFLGERTAYKSVFELVTNHPPQSDQSDIQALADQLGQLKHSMSRDRMLGALSYILSSRPTRDEILSYLRLRNESSESQLDTSYLLIRTMVFLIPLSGLLGTVLGMSDAVTQFSKLLVTFNNAKGILPHLSKPLDSLSLAFDTTILAIGLALIMHILAAVMRKLQERLLSDIDEQCQTAWFQNLRLPGLAQNVEARVLEVAQVSLSYCEELLVQAKATYQVLEESVNKLVVRINSLTDSTEALSALKSVPSDLRLLRESSQEASSHMGSVAQRVEALSAVIGGEQVVVGHDKESGSAVHGTRTTVIGELREVKSVIRETSLSEVLARSARPGADGTSKQNSKEQR